MTKNVRLKIGYSLASFMKSSDLHRVKRGQGWMPLPNQPVSVCILAVVYELSLGGLVHRFLTGRNTITAAAPSFSLPSLHLSPHLQSQACIGNLTSLYLHLALPWLGLAWLAKHLRCFPICFHIMGIIDYHVTLSSDSPLFRRNRILV